MVENNNLAFKVSFKERSLAASSDIHMSHVYFQEFYISQGNASGCLECHPYTQGRNSAILSVLASTPGEKTKNRTHTPYFYHFVKTYFTFGPEAQNRR